MATTPRKTFPELQALSAPVVDSDVLAVYRTPGPAKRTTATIFADYIKAFFSASGGSALVNFLQAGTGAVARTLQAKNRDTLDVRDFGVIGSGDEGTKIQAALTEAAASGKELLWPAGSYTSSIALSCGAVRIRCTGPVTLTYSSATHISAFFAIAASGVDVSVLGTLLVDANNKANIALRIINENATAARLTLGNVEARNAYMVTGSVFNAGAGAIIARGNFSIIAADRVYGKTVGRDAGTGSVGNNGSVGVEFGITSGYAPKVIDVKIVGAESITTQDTPGTAACYDCDGVIVQQNDVVGSSLNIGFVPGVDCQGRTLKVQSFRAAQIGQVATRRSIAGITDGSTEVAVQRGEAVIGQVQVTYTGNGAVVHGQGSTCVSAFTSSVRADGYGIPDFQNVTVRDETTSTETVDYIANLDIGSVSTEEVFASLRNVNMIGKSAKYLVQVGNSATSGDGPFNLRIDGFIGNLSLALIAAGTSAKENLRALVSGVWNVGSEVPAIRRTDGATLGNTFGRLVDGGGNVGIKKQTGRDDTPGLYGEQSAVGGYTNSSQVAGDAFLFAGQLATGTTLELGAFGAVPGSARFWAGSPDYGAVGEFTTAPSSNTITTIQSSSGLTVGSGGVDPMGADIGIWKSSSGTRLTIKNASGSSRAIIVKTLG